MLADTSQRPLQLACDFAAAIEMSGSRETAQAYIASRRFTPMFGRSDFRHTFSLVFRGIQMTSAVNVLALVREGHRFVFLYDDDSVDTVLASISEYARDPELEFTWYDAAVLAQRVRHLRAECSRTEDFPSLF